MGVPERQVMGDRRREAPSSSRRFIFRFRRRQVPPSSAVDSGFLSKTLTNCPRWSDAGSGEKRARPHAEPRPEPDMIDVINGQPRWKRSAPAGRGPAGEGITLCRQRVEADAAAGRVEVAGDRRRTVALLRPRRGKARRSPAETEVANETDCSCHRRPAAARCGLARRT